MIKTHHTMENLNMDMDTISVAKEYWDERVKILLQQLARYEEIESVLVRGTKKGGVKGAFSFKKKGWQNLGDEVPLSDEDRDELKKEQQAVGDAMKFDNPYVWIKYKGLAYGNHTDPGKRMENLSDFIEHMKREVICPKRFEMLNKTLAQTCGQTLESGLVSLDMPLSQVAEQDPVIQLSLDPKFIGLWCAHEYDSHGKWTRWDKDQADGGIHCTGCC